MRPLVAFSMLFLTALIAYGQGQNDFPHFGFGIRGGGVSSQVDFDPQRVVDEQGRLVESIPGFQGGVFFRHVGQKHLGIQLEALYVEKGWHEVVVATGDEETYNLDYFRFPFTTYAYLGGRSKIYINAGGYLSYRLRAHRTINAGGSETTVDMGYVRTRDNLFDYGLIAGGGISHDLGFGVIAVDARITVGYGNVFKPDIPNLDFSRYRTVELSASYFFNVSGGGRSIPKGQAE